MAKHNNKTFSRLDQLEGKYAKQPKSRSRTCLL